MPLERKDWDLACRGSQVLEGSSSHRRRVAGATEYNYQWMPRIDGHKMILQVLAQGKALDERECVVMGGSRKTEFCVHQKGGISPRPPGQKCSSTLSNTRLSSIYLANRKLLKYHGLRDSASSAQTGAPMPKG